ncbi:hypothetical protein JCM19300_3038 [Algibacter lectus]|uniref:Uncharacterized protein n=1 Tax=Algibacter lectus TaxID=221126 RepID=A0A090W438_9FLAO|nr:hypothetical protein JCM19300_3038 [Algibacter lectus]
MKNILYYLKIFSMVWKKQFMHIFDTSFFIGYSALYIDS